jgi:hypothetical protein
MNIENEITSFESSIASNDQQRRPELQQVDARATRRIGMNRILLMSRRAKGGHLLETAGECKSSAGEIFTI